MRKKLLAGLLLLSGLTVFSEEGLLDLKPAARITDGRLPEISGLAPSARAPGLFWAVNDTGNPAQVMAIDEKGQLAGEPVEVRGAQNLDWEAVCVGDGKLFVGDVGDNSSVRLSRTVYVLPEPDPRQGGAVQPERQITLRFPDQQAGKLEHDCEAMFFRNGHLWFLTKHRFGVGHPAPTTRLYRLDDETSGLLTVVDRADQLGGFVTDAALSPDGKTLAVLTLSPIEERRAFVWLFAVPTQGDKLLSGPRRLLRLGNAKQAESVAFLDGERLLVANEQRDLFVVPITAAQPWAASSPQP